MSKQPKLLDTVAILNDLSIERSTLVEPDYSSINYLPGGLAGTIVEVYQQKQNNHYLVEFADSQGQEYAMTILKPDEFLVLQYELAAA
jgi:hypothetical protein